MKKIYLFCLLLLSACSTSDSLVKNNASNSAANQENIVQIAILFPVDDKNKDLGAELSTMVKIGLKDYAETKIQLRYYDSSTPDALSSALDKIIALGTDLIIGPLYSASTELASEKIAGTGILMFSLSNNPVLAKGNTYLLGHMPMQQTEFLLDSMLANNYSHYITLLPQGQYGENIKQYIADKLKAKGSNGLVYSQFYANDADGLQKSLDAIEVEVDKLNEQDQNILLPVIFLSDDPVSLKFISDKITKQKLDKKAVIAGDSRLHQSVARNMDYVYTGGMNLNTKEIDTKATDAGVVNLTFLHYIAYDAGMIVAKNIGKHFQRKAFIENLMQSGPINGLSGKIKIEDNLLQRTYQVIHHKAGDLSLINASDQ